MLDELDREMEARELNFVRYADDCIIMVGSRMAADKVMQGITKYIEQKLMLKVNVTKSKVDKPQGIKYLGSGFYYDSRAKEYKARPHAKAVAKFKANMKEMTCRSWGVSNECKVQKLNQLIRGWINYFRIGSMKVLCANLDGNIRYRLHMCIWKHWKTPKNKAKSFMKLGIDRRHAWLTRALKFAEVCKTVIVCMAINNKRLAAFGLVFMTDYYAQQCEALLN